MELGFDKAKVLRYMAITAKHLRDPVKLRLAVVTVLVVTATGTVYLPFSRRIEHNRRHLTAERSRYQNITDVEKLREQVQLYRGRIGEHSDANEWVKHVLDGLRGFRVKLRDMASKKLRHVGPYAAVTLSMEIEGSYLPLKGFVEWLEFSGGILRVDLMRFEKRSESLLMKITVLGLVPKDASTT